MSLVRAPLPPTQLAGLYCSGWQGSRPPAHAQEPIYNDVDSALLRHIGIETVDTPKGFDLLKQTSFASGHGVPIGVSHSILLKEPSPYLSHDLGCTRDYYQGKLDQERYVFYS
jgi:hypothetical protein